MGGVIVNLASCEHYFIRVHENLVEHPNNIILVQTKKRTVNRNNLDNLLVCTSNTVTYLCEGKIQKISCCKKHS